MATEGIQSPSQEDILRADTTFQSVLKESGKPSRPNFLKRAKMFAVPFLAAGTALLAACGVDTKGAETNLNAVVNTVTSTEVPTAANGSPEPPKSTATPFPTGDRLPTFSDPHLNDIGARLANSETRNQVTEKDIIDWNNANQAANKLLDAAATAQADTKQATATAEAAVTQTAANQEPTKALEPIATKVPEASPAEQAIKAGRIELKGEKDWENYFEAITAQEAETLLTKANTGVTEGKNIKFLFPINPQGNPDLIVETVEFNMPAGKSTGVGIKKAQVKTTIGSPVSGNGTVQTNVTIGETLAILALINQGDEHYMITANRENAKSILPLNKPVGLTVGDSLFITGTDKPIGFFSGQQQFIVELDFGSAKVYTSSMEQLLTNNGKIAFIK